MKCFAITGIMGSGKTTVCKIFANRGFTVLSADQIVHDLMMPDKACYRKIIEMYGKECLDSQGFISHPYLAELLFSDELIRKNHEAMIHPLVMQVISEKRSECERLNQTLMFVEVPLLYEAKLESHFDGIIVVTSPHVQIYPRLRTLRNIDEKQIQRRIALQMDQAEKASRADYVIVNEESIEALNKACDQLVKELQEG